MSEPTPEAAEARLAAIRERCEKATPGPWIRSTNGWNVLSKGGEGPAVSERRPYPEWTGLAYDAIPDAEFIANARSDIPYLLAEVARLTAERDALYEAALGYLKRHAKQQGVCHCGVRREFSAALAVLAGPHAADAGADPTSGTGG